MLKKLRIFQNEFIKNNNQKYKRYFFNEINFNEKLIGILGARGVGKTTFLLQYLIEAPFKLSEKLYISADIIEIDSLFDIAYQFYQEGGKLLIIDEIHKYNGFEKELKNIYDMLNLKIIFSGSSALKIDNSKGDLSRRSVIYEVNGLSFREFLEIKHNITLPTYSLDEIIENHIEISMELSMKLNIMQNKNEYYKYGYYPFYFENEESYLLKLNETINTVIETDIPSIFPIEYKNIINLKKLVKLICESHPYTLNIRNLLQKLNMNNDYNRLYKYLYYLDKAKIFNILYPKTRGDNIFTKPEKIYLNNTNLHFAYCELQEIGTIREVFFYSMLNKFKIEFPNKGDFLVEDKYIFEVGGKNKTKKQIKNIENSFIVADDVEIGDKNTIPLYLFGFLY